MEPLKPFDFDAVLFRASSIGDIMTGTSKSWPVEKSVTCKRRLVQLYREARWGRRSMKSNKYVEKGTAVEEDSITLYCQVKRQAFFKNVVRLNNEYFTGECDLHNGQAGINTATKTIDIKSCWDWTTFPSLVDNVDDDYEYQGLTYNDLCGPQCQQHVVAHCLVNTPPELITNEKFMLARKMGEAFGINESSAFIKGCMEIEKNSIFDMNKFYAENPNYEFHNHNWDWDIPPEERVFEFTINRKNEKITAMKTRAAECREWMKGNLK